MTKTNVIQLRPRVDIVARLPYCEDGEEGVIEIGRAPPPANDREPKKVKRKRAA